MATSTLGKRTRSSIDAALKPKLPRAKRQATGTIYNDENENPFVTPSNCASKQDVSSLELDELAGSTPIKTPSAKVKVNGTKPAVLSTKIRASLTTVNFENDENSDPIQTPTPQTPRHRDALSKKIPITPRHRAIQTVEFLTPKTPSTLSTPSGSTTIYNLARQLFTRSADPGRLIGREEERKELAEFVNSRLAATSGGCVYVSGPPGTGKSALVHEVTETIAVNEVKKVYINCMSVKNSKTMYGVLLEAFNEITHTPEGDEDRALQNLFIPRKRTSQSYLVTLDEIDHLLTLDVECLYKLFEWSLHKSSQLVLIGIANALDLTDRFLPRLKARGLKPDLIPFLPYTAAQIKSVITTRLKSLVPPTSMSPDCVPFLHPAAIELCSRKVSSHSGDLRKAFDICRRAIDLIEAETKQKHQQGLREQLQTSPSKKPLGENTNYSSPSSPSKMMQQRTASQYLSDLTVETAPRASIAQLNKVTSSVFGNGANQRLKTLNLQQKAALCALVALEKRKREASVNVMATPSKSNQAAPTVKALYDTYCMLCRRDSVLHPLTSTEFRDVIGSLETLSLISAVDGRNGSFVVMNTPSKRGRKPGFGGGVGTGDEKRVGSCVGERELRQAVEGPAAAILCSILSGEGLEV